MLPSVSLRAVAVLSAAPGRAHPCPLYLPRVPAGFPSPADDYVDRPLDLNDLLVQRPEATFFVEVEGDSMVEAGIHPGDLLVVDRAAEPTGGKIVVAAIDGELTVKRLRRKEDALWLVAENEAYPPIRVTTELVIWGVVRHAIHKVE